MNMAHIETTRYGYNSTFKAKVCATQPHGSVQRHPSWGSHVPPCGLCVTTTWVLGAFKGRPMPDFLPFFGGAW